MLHPPFQDIPGLVRAHQGIDLLVCPSLLDCGPNVLVEGYQLGTPILASDLCGSVADLPPDSVCTVKAPRWWEKPEPAQEYEERLAQAIAGCLTGPPTDRVPPPSELASQLQAILSTWNTLLQNYGLIPSACSAMKVTL